jgi:hypothetical protein
MKKINGNLLTKNINKCLRTEKMGLKADWSWLKGR